MTVVFFLLAVSAVLGVLLGLARLRLLAVLITTLIVTVVAAVVLQNQGFGFVSGIAIVVACQTLHQLGYAFGSFLVNRRSSLAGDQPDDDPGERRHEDIGGEYKQ
jgi:hypothetical protein